MGIYIILSILIIILIVTGVFLIRYYRENQQLRSKYDSIINVDAEVALRQKESAKIQKEAQDYLKKFEQQKLDLAADYARIKQVYDHLRSELAIVEESLEMTSYGLYQPHFEFDTSERYKTELEARRQRQKLLIKNEEAAICEVQWTVDGSLAKGKKQTKESLKLLLRAFNNECDAAVLKVKWNNVNQMEQRIQKAFDAINKLGSTQRSYITTDYLNLKFDELHLTYEYQVKKQEEQEEQRRIKEQIREEEKAQKEFEKAKADAEAEEKRYEEALKKARVEVEKSTGKNLTKLNEQIAQLENQLAEAQAQKERAISRAQLTKSGYVYVISNIGSFGEEVYKIGMTRRLEPMDRVKELGDASVPFQFDVHAMIDSDNAPELENILHKEFESQRVNQVNQRKEFFKVSLSEIEKAVHANHGEIEFTLLAEAQEYRQSQEIIRNNRAQDGVHISPEQEVFPDDLLSAAKI